LKNKKLFAILTLVCFMFTLMPMAAFAATTYAEVDEDSEYVTLTKGEAFADLTITNGTTGSYYVYANTNGAFSKAFGFQKVDVDNSKTDTVQVKFTREGTYELHVVAYDATVAGDSKLTNAEKVALLEDKSGVVMLGKTVVVKPESNEYVLKVVGVDPAKAWTAATKDANDKVAVGANSGYDEVEVLVELTSAISGNAVVGAKLDVASNSYAVDVDKTEVTTNAAGLAKFKVAASIAGNFEVYVEYGSKADLTIDVVSGALTPANIVKISEPTAPMALDSAIDNTVYFNITDANGNAVQAVDKDMIATFDYKVVVTEKPVGCDIVANDIELELTSKGWTLVGEDFDEEGDYTFKVVLANGAYATAKVTVKEFQTPVALKLAYPAPAVELGGEIAVDELVFVDANGVEESAVGKVTLSATGHAVYSFANDGTIVAKDDEKYVGSKITVLAVSEKYDLTAVAELVVANEAAAVAYANTAADVAVNNTLVANIVDLDGNKVSVDTTDKYAIQYIVLEKPENAKVAVSTKSPLDATTGQFKVSFTASAIGEYKLQTVVRSTSENNVVKYYSGIETITVGNTGVEDVVVMSVNSTEIVKNGKVAVIDAAPVVENNRTFVPFRALAEAFGATVAYDEATQAVTAELNGTTVVMTIGSAEYTVNGVAKTADVAPFINGSRTMVPVRFVAEAFGINVTPTYDENGATADILFAK